MVIVSLSWLLRAVMRRREGRCSHRFERHVDSICAWVIASRGASASAMCAGRGASYETRRRTGGGVPRAEVHGSRIANDDGAIVGVARMPYAPGPERDVTTTRVPRQQILMRVRRDCA